MPGRQKPDCEGSTHAAWSFTGSETSSKQLSHHLQNGNNDHLFHGIAVRLGKLSTVTSPVPSTSIVRDTIVPRPGSCPHYVLPVLLKGPWKNAEEKRGRKKQEIPFPYCTGQ